MNLRFYVEDGNEKITNFCVAEAEQALKEGAE